jgi:hypothetical protein
MEVDQTIGDGQANQMAKAATQGKEQRQSPRLETYRPNARCFAQQSNRHKEDQLPADPIT